MCNPVNMSCSVVTMKKDVAVLLRLASFLMTSVTGKYMRYSSLLCWQLEITSILICNNAVLLSQMTGCKSLKGSGTAVLTASASVCSPWTAKPYDLHIAFTWRPMQCPVKYKTVKPQPTVTKLSRKLMCNKGNQHENWNLWRPHTVVSRSFYVKTLLNQSVVSMMML